MTVQHIVLFSFPRELSADEAGQLRAMVASWPDKIGLMSRCRLGTDLRQLRAMVASWPDKIGLMSRCRLCTDLTGARTRGYSFLLYTEFPDVPTLHEYRAHP